MIDLKELRESLLVRGANPLSQKTIEMFDLFERLEKSEAARRQAQAQLEIKKEEVSKTKGAVKALAALQSALKLANSGNAEFELWQDDMVVASVCGQRAQAIAEIMRYAEQYAQDGEVKIEEVIRLPFDPNRASNEGEA